MSVEVAVDLLSRVMKLLDEEVARQKQEGELLPATHWYLEETINHLESAQIALSDYWKIEVNLTPTQKITIKEGDC